MVLSSNNSNQNKKIIRKIHNDCLRFDHGEVNKNTKMPLEELFNGGIDTDLLSE